MDESLDTFQEKKYFLKEALEEGQIDKKTYDKMIKVLNKKNKELKKNWENHNFWHSKTMKVILCILGLIVVALLFMLAVAIWTGAYGDALLGKF